VRGEEKTDKMNLRFGRLGISVIITSLGKRGREGRQNTHPRRLRESNREEEGMFKLKEQRSRNFDGGKRDMAMWGAKT